MSGVFPPIHSVASDFELKNIRQTKHIDPTTFMDNFAVDFTEPFVRNAVEFTNLHENRIKNIVSAFFHLLFPLRKTVSGRNFSQT